MDISYAVKQLDLEIKGDSSRLEEKKKSRETLYGALSSQEKALVDEAQSKLNAPPPKPPK